MASLGFVIGTVLVLCWLYLGFESFGIGLIHSYPVVYVGSCFQGSSLQPVRTGFV